MLQTKSFLEPVEYSDGLRVSIVGKHKWTPEIMEYTDFIEITSGMYDEWLPVFAPPLSLVGDIYIRKTCSLEEEFRDRYLSYIEQPKIDVLVRSFARRALDLTITVLCLEPLPDYCHRKYFAEQCEKYEPFLDLKIR